MWCVYFVVPPRPTRGRIKLYLVVCVLCVLRLTVAYVTSVDVIVKTPPAPHNVHAHMPYVMYMCGGDS